MTMLSVNDIVLQSRQFGHEASCFFKGSEDAKIAIVLEHPSDQDCKTKIPLSGTAGNLLFKILQNYGIKREDCYITCAIKRKVQVFGENVTKISNTEINGWKIILEKELHALKNLKHILVLGKYALQCLTNEQSIMDWRGTVMDFGEDVDKTELSFVTLFEACKQLELDMEVYSEECGCGFQEHYLFIDGELVAEECVDYSEEYNEETEEYESSGGFDDWDFEI
jgi:uracil-DNA glycosylase family 4